MANPHGTVYQLTSLLNFISAYQKLILGLITLLTTIVNLLFDHYPKLGATLYTLLIIVMIRVTIIMFHTHNYIMLIDDG